MGAEWRRATEQVATLDEARALLETLGTEFAAAHHEIATLRHRLGRLCRDVFGRRSEKGVPEGQALLALPGAAGPNAPDASDEDARPTPDEAATPARRRRHLGRRRLPEDLKENNWLFCGSEAAAHRAAVLLSLVQTCKRVGVEPFVYLRDVIERVSTRPMSCIGELVPWRWRQLRQAPKSEPAA